jgi:hypothetical protein
VPAHWREHELNRIRDCQLLLTGDYANYRVSMSVMAIFRQFNTPVKSAFIGKTWPGGYGEALKKASSRRPSLLHVQANKSARMGAEGHSPATRISAVQKYKRPVVPVHLFPYAVKM